MYWVKSNRRLKLISQKQELERGPSEAAPNPAPSQPPGAEGWGGGACPVPKWRGVEGNPVTQTPLRKHMPGSPVCQAPTGCWGCKNEQNVTLYSESSRPQPSPLQRSGLYRVRHQIPAKASQGVSHFPGKDNRGLPGGEGRSPLPTPPPTEGEHKDTKELGDADGSISQDVRTGWGRGVVGVVVA